MPIYRAAPETRRVPSREFRGSMSVQYLEDVVCVHAVAEDESGGRAERTVCGADYRTVDGRDWRTVMFAARCDGCVARLGLLQPDD